MTTMTTEQADEMRELERALLHAWDHRRDTAWMADMFGMEESDVASMIARLLEARREVREPSRFCRPPRRPSVARSYWHARRLTPRPRAA